MSADLGARPSETGSRASAKPASGLDPTGFDPARMSLEVEQFLTEGDAKNRKFSEFNPALWRDLLAKANPPTLTVCRHLESVEADQACPCRYPGSVWADGDRVLFTMGDQWGEEGMRAGRIEREAEIASAQLITCLFNNAERLIAIATEAGTDTTGTGVAEGKGAGRKASLNHIGETNDR